MPRHAGDAAAPRPPAVAYGSTTTAHTACRAQRQRHGVTRCLRLPPTSSENARGAVRSTMLLPTVRYPDITKARSPDAGSSPSTPRCGEDAAAAPCDIAATQQCPAAASAGAAHQICCLPPRRARRDDAAPRHVVISPPHVFEFIPSQRAPPPPLSAALMHRQCHIFISAFQQLARPPPLIFQTATPQQVTGS